VGLGKGGERHHLAIAIAHIPAAQVPGLHPEGGVPLDIDFFGPVLVQEVIHVGAAPGRSQHVVHVPHAEAQGPGPGLIHIQLVLGAVIHAVGPYRHQILALTGLHEELITGGDELFVTQASLVLQLEVEAGGIAQVHHRRGHKGENLGLPQLRKRRHGPVRYGFCLLDRCLALIPVLQHHKGNAAVLAATAETEALDGKHGGHVFALIIEEMVFHLFQYLDRTFLGGPRGQLNLGENYPLVLIGQKGGG